MRTIWTTVYQAGLALAAGLVGLALLVVFVPGFGLGLVFLIPGPVAAAREFLATLRDRYDIVAGYRPAPPEPVRRADGYYEHDGGLHKRSWWPRTSARLEWVLGDRATGRDLLFLFGSPVVGLLPVAPAVALVVAGGWWLAGLPLAVAFVPVALRAWPAWCRLMLRAPGPVRLSGAGAWFGRRMLAFGRLFALAVTTVLVLGATLVFAVAMLLCYGLGLVLVFPAAVDVVRRIADLRRSLSGRWSGRPIESPYRPVPPPEREPDGRYKVGKQLFRTPAWAGWSTRFNTYARDPQTWRDALWLLVEPVTAGLLAAAGPIIWYLVGSRLVGDAFDGGFTWWGPVRVVAGVAVVLAMLAAAPEALRLHGRLTALLLAPTRTAALARRVERLTETRADAAATAAAELRRIERDLHDGAQARLVSIGLAMGAVESLIDTDPATARRLAASARDAAETALVELRALVRGIHPPVLAERGLADAVRALALDFALPVSVTVELPGRLTPAVESTVYFAVAELLTNAAKHAQATSATVRLEWTGEGVRAVVTDDGRGGVQARPGGGLDGLRRRLATFDGALHVDSPAGGPTTMTVEVACAS